jgi:hypothetical protein
MSADVVNQWQPICVMPDAKVKVDMWLWPMIGWNPIILVFWARNGRGYGPRLTICLRSITLQVFPLSVIQAH